MTLGKAGLFSLSESSETTFSCPKSILTGTLLITFAVSSVFV